MVNGELKNYVSERTVNYMVKYVTKVDEIHRAYKPKILCSPGIGASFVETYNFKRHKFNGSNTRDYYETSNGHKMRMPIYYRNKLYNDEEREQLWINKLNEEIRYVGGEKVSTKNGLEQYFRLREWYRKKNRIFGYGKGEVDYEQKEYENRLRELKVAERIMRRS